MRRREAIRGAGAAAAWAVAPRSATGWSAAGSDALASSRSGPPDPWRPLWHFTPPYGWTNDPNGLVRFGEEYHLFHQHHPFSTDWGPMHWGHAVSADLLHWRHLPIALAPTPGGPDAGGCFSGSAVDDAGVLSLLYTGHGPRQVQCLATSRDGRTFSKHPANPVIAAPPAGFAAADFRDPKVRRVGERWQLVAGSHRDGRGATLLYESSDLRQWEFRSVLAESDGTLGSMWECPDLFALDGRDVLLYSPMGLSSRSPLALVGRVGPDLRLTPSSRHVADYGADFYAPQSLEDADGRRVVIGWLESWGSKRWPTKPFGWAGAMSVPRRLSLLPDGTPCWAPVAQLETLRRDPVRIAPRGLGPGRAALDALAGDSLDLELEIEPAAARSVALIVRCSADDRQQTRLVFDRARATLAIDRERAGAGDGGVHAAPLRLAEGETLRLRVLLDRSSIEVFAQDGRVALSDRVYPEASSLGTALEADGAARLLRLDAWRLEAALP